ncbi:uncharacterized protein LOC121730332 [Aricia agestis]|uniref:uncharacterized protein LOC121730332 n=1 Tax=Aricia agestis TaxID=91739 RepID=UPI001C20ACC6|nr:uncharacterized protein LOC121730332 [Aricia agestis]XP_041975269.1 uncharacterized protein LOC121730332 [Aricia agestis]XP_041975270.1 uncharacterized protein LOC121730332 [Aricia agestis]
MSRTVVLFVVLAVAAAAPMAAAQRNTADSSIAKDRVFRQSVLSTGKNVPAKPKWGFFGTIFTVILEQINETKSAYNQISDLVNNNFADDNAVPATTDATTNTTEATKITRKEFLQILDRNLKGLARLRNLEWREAKKDSRANLKEYWNEIFSGKKTRSTR